VDNKIFDGISFAPGEFGHMIIYDGGETCVCGNQGCWEAHASDRATIKRFLAAKKIRQNESNPVKMQDVVQAAINLDAVAVRALKETGYYLGIGMANIIRAVDPSAIVLNGHISKVWDIIYNEILEGLSEQTFFGLEKRAQIIPSSLSENPLLIGAASLSLEKIFNA